MYYQKTVEEVFAELGTSAKGLSQQEAKARLEKYGPNELPEKKKSKLILFLKQFHSILVYILIAALVFSIVLPFYENHGPVKLFDFIDAIAIGIIIVLNAVLGFLQENKAENAIALLKKMSAPTARVLRGGDAMIIPAREVVPGDIILMEVGDRICADGRVIDARRAAVDEASLTGESKPARKQRDALKGEKAVADQTNMVFKGTVITSCCFRAVVTGTGVNTELGKIATMVSGTEHPPTPLEKSMSKLGRWLGAVVLLMCGVILVIGVLREIRFADMLLASASLAVSAVPEGLPAIVTVCLAIGVQRMIKRRVLIRELQSIETLGSITVICSDKTGTITENQMEVQELWVNGQGQKVVVMWGKDNTSLSLVPDAACNVSPRIPLLLRIGASCNNAHSGDVGDPTEIGLLEAATAAGEERFPIEDEEVPFSSEEKYMMTVHEVDGKEVKYLKGAPEKILSLCTHVLHDDGVAEMNDRELGTIQGHNEDMANRALRVLAMAYREGDKTIFVGLTGMMDPPRDTVKEAINTARSAGIRTVMITGDHALTAKAVGKKVGIRSEVLTGEELDDFSEKELQSHVRSVSIFARVSPEHKVRILTALQNQGEIVAMGGDGVNDAPALKKAHVGFAMGKQGTDVARETAEMVLTDDDFSSVVEAVEEGRTIYDNIRKFVVFLLRANFDELAVILGAIIFAIPLPYLPIHILLVNLITDSLPAMALALEKPEPNVMKRPPRDPRRNILYGEYTFIFLAALIATAGAFHVFFTGWRATDSVDVARTMTVTTSILFELFLVMTCRSRRSVFEIGVFSNRYLWGAVGIAFSVLILLMYTPVAPLFRLVPLNASQWILPVMWSGGALVFFETLKLFRRKEA